MSNLVGRRFGNYSLLRLLGQGGFADVYLGEHIHLNTLAAIKVLRTQLGQDDITRFRTEARTIAPLIHPNIVRVLEFDVEGNIPFLVMEYAPNGNLRQRHRENVALSQEVVLPYVKQVAAALQYAHNQKIIHRDIKPENMLIGRHNEILLSDFGIALIAQSTRLQNTQEIVGTAYYMAPEQLKGKPRFASDQYSLGIVVYEWLTGNRPFNGSFNEIASQHIFGSPPPLRERFPYISPDVEQVVMIALAKDPQHRFANIKAFAIALEEASRSPHFFVPFASSPSVTWPVPSITPMTMSATQQFDIASPQNVPLATITPPGQLSSQSSVVTPPHLSSQLPSTIKPLPEASVPLVNPASSDRPPMPKRRVSRCAFIGGLAVAAGLAVGGSGIAWL